ncbi:P22_AR N-terminal domain-containing protein [Pseudomonas linyingensis]|uniref:P22_AR N-terminal domain-containing protein n=1 Tax=Pseudomonas linyingensis TaxID=915471 RepID=A0A1H7A1F6_9PSED|nr:phage antirepressor N-terminal domain-containing protein [Pseudomonas linyingensis]SEJ58274.1 P22_AR N-terminal domain-containing protein [Pseudomonas linyingensis]
MSSTAAQAPSSLRLATVDFHGHALTVITGPAGEHLVAMKPICEAIGLSWRGQSERIQRHEVLKEGARVIRTPSAGGDQETTCLPLDYLNGWLFGVDASRVRPGIRERLVQYQRECFAALAAYWQQGEAVNPRRRRTASPKALPNGLTGEQQGAIKALVAARIEALPETARGKAATRCWSALKSKFGCSYKEIDPEQFTEAVNLVARIVLEGEWMGKPSNFSEIIGRPLARGERWMVCTDTAGREQYSPIPYDACVMTHKELIQAMVTPGELAVSTEEMFEFSMAALANLKARSDCQSQRVKLLTDRKR